MSKPITLFSGYSQRENRTTNYCLLILKMVYEENPKFLGEVLSTLVGENIGDRVGVKFRQQERRTASVPDGLVIQSPFTIYIETKNFDWFYDDQIKNHLAALDREASGLKVLFALSNFESEDQSRFEVIQALCRTKYDGSVVFKAVTFEEFVQALQLGYLPKNLADAIEDFRAYLDEQSLLPSWQQWLDVVNCAGIPDDVLQGHVYMCPATGGSYNHARCKYFGMYCNKRVEQIALIEAVVDVEEESKATIRWQNVSGSKADYCNRAKEKVLQLRPDSYPIRVFLLDQLYETDFRKDSPGGMLGSKQYFSIAPFQPPIKDAASLAIALNGITWSELSDRAVG